MDKYKKIKYNDKELNLNISQIVRDYKQKKLTMEEIAKKYYVGDINGSQRKVIREIIREYLTDEEIKKIKYSIRCRVLTIDKYDKEVVELYVKKRMTAKGIKEYFNKTKRNIGLVTIKKILDRNNIDRELNKGLKENMKFKLRKKEKLPIIIDLHKQGITNQEISKHIGLCEATIRVYLNSVGINTQYSSESYLNKFANDEERKAKEIYENKGYDVLRCSFMCQRDKCIIIPKKIKEKYCSRCPIKKCNFNREFQEYYDFICFKDDEVLVIEVKKIYKSKYGGKRGVVSLGQLMNAGKVIRSGAIFKLLIFDGDEIYEREV